MAVLAVGINFYRDYDRTADVSIEETALISSNEEEKNVIETENDDSNSESADEKNESTDEAEVPETEADETAKESDAQARRQQIYQEESDVRKAQRREALENRQTEEAETQTNVQTNSLTDSQTADAENASETASEGIAETDSETETSASVRQKTYVIRPGDTLYQISMEKYGSIDAIEEICRLNSISQEEIIYPGQVIVLP